MQSINPQQTSPAKRHGHLGDRRARNGKPRDPRHAPSPRMASPVLTPRQAEVAALLVGTGLSCKEIAASLARSEGTVRTHTEKIYRAFDVHSRPELTVVLGRSGNASSGGAASSSEIDARSSRQGG